MVHGLLIAVASPVEASAPGTRASVATAHGLTSSTARGIFLDQGSNPCPCTDRWILNHGTTMEVPKLFFTKEAVRKILLVLSHLGI